MMWEKVKLKELLSQPIQSGYSPVCQKTPNGKWVLGLGALNGSGLDITQIKPAPINDKRINDFLLRPGDFLVSRSNTLDKVGRSALFKGEVNNCSYPDLIMRFRVDTKQIYPEFLEMYLRSTEAVRYFQHFALGTSSSMKKINKDIVENLQIPLPSIVEQKSIADLLSRWCQAIKKIGLLIIAKNIQLNWYRQRLFLSNMKESNSGSWEIVRLAEILKEHGKFSTDVEEVFSVSVHKGVVNQIEHLGRVFAASDKSKYNLVHPGDIVYTKSPTGDFPYGIIKQSLVDKNVIVSPLYGVFTPVSVYMGTILDFYFESPVNTNNYLRPYIQKGAKNTMSITNKVFLSGSLLLPTSIEEQRRITAVICAARQEISLLKKQAEAYCKQKRGLMQKLLTGTWQVNT